MVNSPPNPSIIVKLLLSISFLGVAWLVIGLLNLPIATHTLILELQPAQNDTYQVFYDLGNKYHENESSKAVAIENDNFIQLSFKLPTQDVQGLRVDIGNHPGNIIVKSMRVEYVTMLYTTVLYQWAAQEIVKDFTPVSDISSFVVKDNLLHIQASGEDPFFTTREETAKVLASLPKQDEFFRNLLYIMATMVAVTIFFLATNLLQLPQILYHHMELILYKTYADLRAETERTYLGFLWWIFEPIMYMSVFYFMFGMVLKQGKSDFVQFLLIGLTAWQWMKSCLSHGSDSILAYRGLMQQVHLPKIIFPTILILTDSVKFVFIFVLLLVFLWITGFGVNIHYLALPLVLLVELLFIMGITYVLAAIVPFLPDIRFVVEYVLQALIFVSGVFFAVSSLPPEYHTYFYLNPMITITESYRNILMYNSWPDWQTLTGVGFFSIIGVYLGAYLIARFEYIYPKITL